MKRFGLLLALVFVALARPAWAITFTVTGAEVTASYVEPTLNANGSALTDLARTNVYFQIGTQAPIRGPDVAASALSGGGTITTTVSVPITAGQEADVTFWATASDTSGNESGPSAQVVRRIDRLAPSAPN